MRQGDRVRWAGDWEDYDGPRPLGTFVRMAEPDPEFPAEGPRPVVQWDPEPPATEYAYNVEAVDA